MKQEEKELEARIAWRNGDRGVSQRVTREQEGHGGGKGEGREGRDGRAWSASEGRCHLRLVTDKGAGR